jgi:Resolvase, N terminal domain
MIYGYAWGIHGRPDRGAQVEASTAAGAGQVFRETASGAKTHRAQLRKALAALDAGDVLLVTRLDRLARSTPDLLNTPANGRSVNQKRSSNKLLTTYMGDSFH